MTLIIIGGATASGKSDLALAVAREIGGEIVNADSMQVYRGMDIGTAKLSLADRMEIVHHLIDILDVSADSSAAWYQEKARQKVDELLSASIPVVVVGGTGLYIKALLDDLDFPDTDPVVRQRLELEALNVGGAQMHTKLLRLDPQAAASIPAGNQRRVIRALEVIELTGKPYSASLPRSKSNKYPGARQFAIDHDRQTLDQRIEDRIEEMWNNGFVEEVKELVKQGLSECKTARAALGYAQILRYLRGEIDEDSAKDDTKVATRQYARRQRTWFKRDERITWLLGEMGNDEQVKKILAGVSQS